MNVFHKVTVQSLKKNRTRTLVTIIGIILSAAMITAVTTFASSFLQYALESAVYQDGAWHGNVQGISAESAENISKKEELAASETLQELGYSPLPESKNEAKPYLYVLGTSENPSDLLPIHITSGRYPQNNREILLPNHLSSNGGIFHEIGDTMKLILGNRTLGDENLVQSNHFYSCDENGEEVSEVFVPRETRSYTVVGFFDRIGYSIEDYSAPGYTALTVRDEPIADNYLCDFYFQMKNPGNLFDFMGKNELYGSENHEVLLYLGVFKYGNFRTTLINLCTIVILLIMFGSVSLIYNAFSISMSERTKQFGLMSSVGATKKQLAGMIRWEAWILSLIGIPIGILAGVGGIGVTLYFIGDKFKQLGMPMSMHLHVSFAGIAVAAVVAFVTVFLSAWIPSRRMKKLSAIQAIRQNQDIAVKSKKLRTSEITLKIFGLPGTLAKKYYKRSQKKYRATVISLFMSIVLFISAFTFTGYMEDSLTMGFGDNACDLTLYLSEKDNPLPVPEVLKIIRSEETVTAAASVVGHGEEVFVLRKDLSESAEKTLGPGEDGIRLSMMLAFADDESYEKYLRQQHLNPEEFRSSKQGILLEGAPVFNSVTEKYEYLSLLKNSRATLEGKYFKTIPGYYSGVINEETVEYQAKEGDSVLKMPAKEAVIRNSLEIGAVLQERPYFVSETASFVILYPESIRKEMLPDWETHEKAADFMMQSSDHGKTYDRLKVLLPAGGVTPGNLTDVAEVNEAGRNTVTILRVLSTGFIVLISLIAAANVFNTITTNIGLRKRDFAMLRSVGMTRKQLQGMMNYECVLYGSKSLLYGLPVSILITVLIWKAVSGSFQMAYQFPWLPVGIAVGSVFLVVFATMLYAMGKMKKDNILEDLRSENL